MQNRSEAYQSVLYFVKEADPVRGVSYHDLVKHVSQFIDVERGFQYQMSRLRRTPREAHTATSRKGCEAIARKYIDQAKRQGLIAYQTRNPTTGEDSDERRVFWNRPARSGGTYGKPEGEAEARLHAAFHRYLRGL